MQSTMMLASPEGTALNLEEGLGEVHPFMRAQPSEMRLRTESVCGISSIALARHFEQQGYDVDLIISEPRLDVDPGMRHIFPVVHVDGVDTIVDASYSMFYGYAGLTPGYVIFGGENHFPDEKIMTMTVGEVKPLVDEMTYRAVRFLREREEIEELKYSIPEFVIMDRQEIAATYASIWDPNYFDIWQPSDRMIADGKRLASFVLPAHVKLVD